MYNVGSIVGSGVGAGVTGAGGSVSLAMSGGPLGH